MRLGAYLRSIAPQIAVMAAAAGVCGFIFAVGSVPGALSVLVLAVLLCAMLLCVAIDFQRKRVFFGDLERCTQPGENPLWVSEMIDRPECLEGVIAHDAVRAIAKSANDEVADARRQAVEYREYVETWVHEVKLPIAAAHLMVENLQDALSPADGSAPDAGALDARVETLDEELDRVEGYVEQALFYARSETVERDYLIRSHTLSSLVAGTLRANARMLISAHAVPVQENLDFTVFTDEKWMRFIFGQVIQNSVKYARDGGVRIVFRGELVDAGTAEERVELSIADNGRGVSAADLPRVFEKGFTGEVGRTGKRSTGIGLYLAERLCSKMGVGIRASSVEGEGFTVTIAFPTNKFHYFEQGI